MEYPLSISHLPLQCEYYCPWTVTCTFRTFFSFLCFCQRPHFLNLHILSIDNRILQPIYPYHCKSPVNHSQLPPGSSLRQEPYLIISCPNFKLPDAKSTIIFVTDLLIRKVSKNRVSDSSSSVFCKLSTDQPLHPTIINL